MAEAIFKPGFLGAWQRAALSGKRVLFLLSAQGHVVQETLIPAACLEDSGLETVFATLNGGPVQFDFVCNVLAVLEAFTSNALKLLLEEIRSPRLDQTESIGDLASHKELEGFLDRIDALVIPGGHGRVYADFIRHDTTRSVVEYFFDRQKVIGLLCHSVPLAEYVEPGKSKQVTCWPRRFERLLSVVPFMRSTFVPFGSCVQDIVESKGMEVRFFNGRKKNPHAVIDRRLVTGWGPWSMDEFSYAMKKLLCENPL